MDFLVPEKIQVIILMAKLPANMDDIALELSSVEKFDDVTVEHVRKLITLSWEHRAGKKPQQNAQKLSAVKRGPNEPTFSDQQQDHGEGGSRGRGGGRNCRGNRAGKQSQQKKKEEDAKKAEAESQLATGPSDEGYAQIASPVFLPPAPVIARPVPGPSSSIYPNFNAALELTRRLQVRPMTETLKRLETSQAITQDPRRFKRQRLEDRIESCDEVVSLGSESDVEMDVEIAEAAGLFGTIRYTAAPLLELQDFTEANLLTVHS